MVNGLDILDSKCNNTHIYVILNEKKKISLRGKAFWDNIFMDWKKAWILKVLSKLKKFTSKILRTIYQTLSHNF